MAMAKQLEKQKAERQAQADRDARPPCQQGERCEWASETGSNKITCLRVAGCVKK